MDHEIPAHRIPAPTPRSGDSVMIVGSETKKVSEKDRKSAEAKAAEAAAKKRAATEKAATGSDSKSDASAR